MLLYKTNSSLGTTPSPHPAPLPSWLPVGHPAYLPVWAVFPQANGTGFEFVWRYKVQAMSCTRCTAPRDHSLPPTLHLCNQGCLWDPLPFSLCGQYFPKPMALVLYLCGDTKYRLCPVQDAQLQGITAFPPPCTFAIRVACGTPCLSPCVGSISPSQWHWFCTCVVSHTTGYAPVQNE